MAKITNGILGGLRGKIGPVVGASWKGIDYIRHKGIKSKKPRSQKQLEQQAKFSLITKFVSKLGPVIMKTIQDEPGKTSINVAYQYVHSSALRGTFPDYFIDYSKVLVSKGELLNANNPVAFEAGDGKVGFNWDDNTGALAGFDDRAILVVYCPETRQLIYNMEGASRNAANDVISTHYFLNKKVHTWLSFVSSNNEYATSVYTGTFQVT